MEKIHIQDLAKKIWKNNRFVSAITKKAQNAHDKEELLPEIDHILRKYPRYNLFSNDIFIELNDVESNFTNWCHRDKEAKHDLDIFFQSEDWKKDSNNTR